MQDDSGNRQTLLESIMADTLIEILTAAEGRQRMTSNLHPFATRALFSGTEGVMTNQELLKWLRPPASAGVVGRDTKEARNLRSIGNERGLKIGDLRRNALNLLASGKVSQADIARAWAYAHIHSCALRTVQEFRAVRDALTTSTLDSNPTLGNEMLNRCYELICASLQEEFDAASQAAVTNSPNSEERRFLHFAASLIIESMHMDRPVLASHQELLDIVYPEIDRYKLGQDPEEEDSYLSSPPSSHQ